MDLKEIAKNLVYCKLSQKSFATCEYLSHFGDIPTCTGLKNTESCPYRKDSTVEKLESPYPEYVSVGA